MLYYFDGSNVYFGAEVGNLVITSPIDITGKLLLNGAYGNAGQVLTSNGSPNAPSWETVTSGVGQWTAGAVASVSSPMSIYGTALVIGQATTSTSGFLTSGDWNTFAGYGTDIGNLQGWAATGTTYDVIFVSDIGPPQVKYTIHFVNGLFTGVT